jgi:hypothetical protein
MMIIEHGARADILDEDGQSAAMAKMQLYNPAMFRDEWRDIS